MFIFFTKEAPDLQEIHSSTARSNVLIEIKKPAKAHTHTQHTQLHIIAHIFLIRHAWGKQISDGLP